MNKETSYLTEVLDSAQEGFPHMWVNSEKYMFSDHIIEEGIAVHRQFELVRKLVAEVYSDCQETYDYTAITNLNRDLPKKISLLKEGVARFD
jgi:hypothetical protein